MRILVVSYFYKHKININKPERIFCLQKSLERGKMFPLVYHVAIISCPCCFVQEADELLDVDLADPELHKAATKIQASFRGHKARKADEAVDNK